MTDIDNLVDKALDASKKVAPRKMLDEPRHVLVRRWFKTWKMCKYETTSDIEAYEKFNRVMEQLSQLGNVVIDAAKSRVTAIDIAPAFSASELKYVVEVYWRDKESA